MDGYYWCAETGDSIKAGCYSSTRASIGGREDLRSVRIQDAIHDICWDIRIISQLLMKSKHTLEEGLKTSEYKLEIGIRADSEAEQKDAGDQSGNCNSALPADVLDVDSISSDERAWDANNRSDSVISVHNVVWRRGLVLASVLKILWEECVEEGVSHSYSRPAEPYQGRCELH